MISALPGGDVQKVINALPVGDLQKVIDAVRAGLPAALGAQPPLGQVNGALGNTLGQLLDGKKTAIGIIGAAATQILTQVPAGSGVGKVIAMLAPGLGPYAMPIFLAFAAWGALGKFEKWQQAATPAGFTCPETLTCRPKRTPKPGEWNVGFLHHIHSGEEFGPLGVIVSILSGLALIFFAISGLYLYIQMYRGRLVRTEAGKSVRGGRFFW